MPLVGAAVADPVEDVRRLAAAQALEQARARGLVADDRVEPLQRALGDRLLERALQREQAVGLADRDDRLQSHGAADLSRLEGVARADAADQLELGAGADELAGGAGAAHRLPGHALQLGVEGAEADEQAAAVLRAGDLAEAHEEVAELVAEKRGMQLAGAGDHVLGELLTGGDGPAHAAGEAGDAPEVDAAARSKAAIRSPREPRADTRIT